MFEILLLIRFVSCSRKIREESTVRIKFTRTIIFTKNYYYYIIIIKIYRNMLEYLAWRYNTQDKILNPFFTFNKLLPNISRTLSINILHKFFVHLAWNLKNSNFLGILKKKRNRAFFASLSKRLANNTLYGWKGEKFHKFYKYYG